MSNNLLASASSGAEREAKNAEIMKSYAWIQTADGSIQEVEREVVTLWPTIDPEMKKGLGSSQNSPIILHPRVAPTTLSLVIDYCRFHLAHKSFQEHETFVEKFLQMDARRLADLLNVAVYLRLGPLLNSTKKALGQKIGDKSKEEIWDMLHLYDDLPEEGKMKLSTYSDGDSRRRLLKKCYAKHKKSIQENLEILKDFVTGVEPMQHEDTREVDDLVSYINGDTKGVKTSKKKKNRKKRKEHKITSSNSTSSEASASQEVIEKHDEGINASDSANDSVADMLDPLGTQDESINVAEDASDDDLVPAHDEKTDREVFEFAWILNLDPASIS
ncbi:SKP1-like protein 20 isoform X2 [Daucus carota subsp. sativus]|nr:PREDICTED: SKP1-like protein 20 isoform X3 [Daucus carota subsp. sativus]XP_017236025.1 PREDICTED: SKP1-like protein 20 isoform X3 [Daucus carota subsp. sativus]XP_017236026.1 PREDICTED: SKP1-like protein 20 isoform X3 [Daucus carota subsp. sativus]XP_017236027.1 PREDICTED: SKP1-like protein 20 isoform X3 [Daucus carota subsp. sativus]XP_017236028.1 PREDICTED: SKP1-like protein 20 isoform X3 [Daucus carota subsp. sativus]